MTHDDILRELVYKLEQTQEECARRGRIFLLDGRDMTALLRALVDCAPDYESDTEGVKERNARMGEGAAYSIASHQIKWTKGGAS